MSEHAIRTGAVTTFFRLDGPSRAPVLMMAHAMGTSHRIWDGQARRLARRFRVLRYDWRGHGATSVPPGPYALAELVADAKALLDVLRVQRVHWVGLSTGGVIGQGLALAFPDRIASLALCNSMARSGQWYAEWASERHRVARSEGMSAIWELTDRLWFTDTFVDACPRSYESVRDVFVRTSVPGYISATSAVVDLDYEQFLHRIRAPTLVLGAGDDAVTPPDTVRVIAERIPGARLEILPGLRHFSNVEAPEQFNSVLEPFLDEVVA